MIYTHSACMYRESTWYHTRWWKIQLGSESTPASDSKAMESWTENRGSTSWVWQLTALYGNISMTAKISKLIVIVLVIIWQNVAVHSTDELIQVNPLPIVLILSPPILLRLYALPYWSNPPFLIFDTRALWCSGLSTRVLEWQKLKMVG